MLPFLAVAFFVAALWVLQRSFRVQGSARMLVMLLAVALFCGTLVCGHILVV